MRCFSYIFLSTFLSLACFQAVAGPVTIEQAEGLLATKNRDVLSAERAAEGLRAGVGIAGQAPNPTLSWSASSIDTRAGIGSGSLRDKRVDQTVGLSQLIERGDKRELRTAAASAQAQAGDDDVANVRRQQRLALYQAYFDLKAAQERSKLLDDTAALYRKSLAAAELRQKVGDLAPVEVSRLRVEALRAENDARSAAADLVRARRTLAYLIGQEAQADTLDPTSAWPSQAALTDGTFDMDQRADIRAATARVEAAQQTRQLARSFQTRDVTVGASLERYPPTAGVTYGVSVSVPLFVRYHYEGEIAKAEADYGAALQARESVVAQAQNEIARARADLAAAVDRLARVEGTSLPEARKVAQAAEFAYSKGAMSLTDLLDARRTLRAIEMEAVATRADHAKARAAWLAATAWETQPPTEARK